MTKLNESEIQNKITDYLDSLSFCKWTKTVTNTRSGEADIIACIYGNYMEIEVKVEGAKPTQLQAEKLYETYLADGTAFYASSVEDVMQVFLGQDTDKLVQNWYKPPESLEL